MLSTNAYSSRRKSFLAILLSWVGGFANVITFLLSKGVFTSHMSGISTRFGVALVQSASEAAFYAGLLLSFVLGAAGSGLLTEGAIRFKRHSRYVLPLGVEAALLLIVVVLDHTISADAGWKLTVMTYAAALAMGLQNATISKISGGEVRTTHLTGVLTDLGLESFQYFARRGRAHKPDAVKKFARHASSSRLAVLIAIVVSFIAGVVGGTLAYPVANSYALLAPIIFLLILVIIDWLTPMADIRAIDATHDDELERHGVLAENLPHELALFRMDDPHHKAHHRAPDFQSWLSKIDDSKRIVILLLWPLAPLDQNALLDLEAALKRLHDENKSLLIANVSAAQYAVLRQFGFIEKIGTTNIFPDLEFAIATARSMLDSEKSGAI